MKVVSGVNVPHKVKVLRDGNPQPRSTCRDRLEYRDARRERPHTGLAQRIRVQDEIDAGQTALRASGFRDRELQFGLITSGAHGAADEAEQEADGDEWTVLG